MATRLNRLKSFRRGFTLLEILISIAIFAIGGVFILSLFLASSSMARKAADANRAVDVATSVRSCIEASLLAPPRIRAGRHGPTRYYPIAFPFASFKNLSPRLGPNVADTSGVSPVSPSELEDAEVPTYFLSLPHKAFTGEANMSQGDDYTYFPADLVDIDGQPISTDSADKIRSKDTGSARRVLYCKPSVFSLAGKDRMGKYFDADDNDVYAFNFFIRRSVARTNTLNATGSNENRLVEGLYTVHLRVYKAYDPTPNVNNRPIHEFVFSVTAAE